MQNLNDYQKFVASVKLPSITSLPHAMRLLYATAEIGGEAGEITEKVKKIIRDRDGVITDEDRKSLGKEVGDTLYGLASICVELDISFQDVLDTNYAKLLARLETNTISGNGDNREERK